MMSAKVKPLLFGKFVIIRQLFDRIITEARYYSQGTSISYVALSTVTARYTKDHIWTSTE